MYRVTEPEESGGWFFTFLTALLGSVILLYIVKLVKR